MKVNFAFSPEDLHLFGRNTDLVFCDIWSEDGKQRLDSRKIGVWATDGELRMLTVEIAEPFVMDAATAMLAVQTQDMAWQHTRQADHHQHQLKYWDKYGGREARQHNLSMIVNRDLATMYYALARKVMRID